MSATASQRTTVITGAAGFVGQGLAARMREVGYPDHVRLVDCIRPPCPPGDFAAITADLSDRDALAAAVAGANRVIHLAALAGGAAEADPPASRTVNLDATLDLLEVVGAETRLVFAGSIAVFGDSLPDRIDDVTRARPASVYGAHKRMAEIAVEDAVRRRARDALVLRLPGIVARPRGAGGFRSAFMSDVVSAIAAGDPFALPVGPDATMWLMSIRCCADNLLHAVAIPRSGDPVVTLPALRLSMTDYVAALAEAAGRTAAVRYDPDPAIEAAFGRMPPLDTTVADRLGFHHDGDAVTLAARALSGLDVAQSS